MASNKKKKAIKQMQKQNRERNKEKANIIREVIELPSLDLNLARKEQGEKAYTIYLFKQMIERCDYIIKTQQHTNNECEMDLIEWLTELASIANTETWYYYEKAKEFILSEIDLNTIEILKNNSKRYLVHWDSYSLNIMERITIRIEIYMMMLILSQRKVFKEKELKYIKLNSTIILNMLLGGLEECEVEKVEIYCDENENVLKVECTYGRKIEEKLQSKMQTISKKIFDNQIRIYYKCNEEGKIIKTGTTIDIVLDLTEKINKHTDVSGVQFENSHTDYVSILEQGIALKHKGKYEEAKDMYVKAINIDNTHPNGYYNLGKVLYILGNYEASAKAYKAAYERGICELMRSTQPQFNTRSDSNSFYVHLGHALIDIQNVEGRYSEYVKQYQDGVDPSRVKGYIANRGQVRTTAYHEYDKMCVEAAREYLEGNN